MCYKKHPYHPNVANWQHGNLNPPILRYTKRIGKKTYTSVKTNLPNPTNINNISTTKLYSLLRSTE